MLSEAPDAIEETYKNHPSAVWFGVAHGTAEDPKINDMFCYVATAKSHVNLGFCYGASLADPDRVLEGQGKKMRHVKFSSPRDLERAFVRRYIRAATERALKAHTTARRKR